MNYFIKNLNYYIKKEKIQLVELADRLNISADKIYEMLSDRSTVEVDVLQGLARYFDLSIDDMVNKDLSAVAGIRSKSIKLLILDVDGVLTDGGMYYTEQGDEFKKFNAKDGMAIKHLTKEGVQVGIISSGFNSSLIESRAHLLGIQRVYAGAEPKEKILQTWVEELEISMSNVAIIGDDVNDLKVMKLAEVAACPSDAVLEVRKVCQVILQKRGGAGCVREFIDTYMR